MQSYLRLVDAHNYTRIIKAFANKHDIAINNNSLGIHKQCISENEEIWINTNIIKVFNQKSSLFYVVEKSKEHRKSMRENKRECSDKYRGLQKKQ